MTTTVTGQGTATMQQGTTELATTDIPVLTMAAPMLGFPEHARFALARLDEQGAVCDLHSLDDEGVRFVVVPPSLFFPDYAPEINDATAAMLQAERAEDLVALLVVTLGEGLADATANLLAPVLLNPDKRLAAQVVLDDVELPLRAPLVPDHAPED
jgi:flagellar assembly factor FliW